MKNCIFTQKDFTSKEKAKSLDDEKNFKLSEKVYEMFEDQIKELFENISKKSYEARFGVIDCTITVADLVNWLKKAGILFGVCPKRLLKPVHEEAKKEEEVKPAEGEAKEEEAPKEGDGEGEGEGDEEEKKRLAEVEAKKQAEEAEAAKYRCPDNMITLVELMQIIFKYQNAKTKFEFLQKCKISPEDYNKEFNTYKLAQTFYLTKKGVEIVYFELKEILLNIAMIVKSRDLKEGDKPKIRQMLKTFLEEQVLNFKTEKTSTLRESDRARVWPVSGKEKLIRQKKAIEEQREAEERKRREVEEKLETERRMMTAEDFQALSQEEIKEKEAEIAKKLKDEQDEIKRQQEQEAAEMSDDDEDLDDEDVSDSEIADY